MSSIRTRAGSSFPPDRSAGRDHCFFSEILPHRSTKPSGRSYLRLHQPNLHCLPDLVIPSGPTTPKFWTHPSCFQWLFHTNGLSWPMFRSFLSSLNTSNWLWWAPYLSLISPRPGTSSNRPWFTAWPHMGTSKPNTSSSHLQIALQLMLCGSRQNKGSG